MEPGESIYSGIFVTWVKVFARSIQINLLCKRSGSIRQIILMEPVMEPDHF